MKQKKIKILTSAFNVFTEKGFHEAKMKDIAVNAGVGKGTIYEYFSSKEELFIEMIRFVFDYFIKNFIDKIESKDNFIEKLISIADILHEFVTSNSDIMDGSFISATLSLNDAGIQSVKTYIEKIGREVMTFIAGVLRGGVSEGYVIEEKADEYTAGFILNTAMHLANSCNMNFYNTEYETLKKRWLEMILKSLK